MGAVGKIMWSLILIETGLCKQGTANKCFLTQMTTGGTGAFEQWENWQLEKFGLV